MDEKKPIRKHSGLRRFLMNAGYYSRKILGIRTRRGLTGLVTMGIGVTLASCFCCLIWVYIFLTVPGLILHDIAKKILFALIIGVCSLSSAAILYRVRNIYDKLPQGHFLNPVRPNVNEILPEAEVLVRASIATDAAQKETLLRPAAATDETDPQTLLRAANKTD